MANMEEMIDEVEEWAARELPASRRDRDYIRRFLQGCKMRPQITKTKMTNFHKLRERTAQWFSDRDPQDPILAQLLDLGVFLPLPQKDEEGRTIIVVRATINNPRQQSMVNVFKIGMMVLDAAMEEDQSITREGVVVLIDLREVSMLHALQMTPPLIMKAVHSWQDCYPIRIKSIHFINCPMHVNAVLSIFKTFMRDKLKQRIHTHRRDLTGLAAHISPMLLPIEYQGTAGSIVNSVRYWKDFTNSKRDWFLQASPSQVDSATLNT